MEMYKVGIRWHISEAVKGVLICGFLGWIFYENLIGAFAAIPIAIYLYRRNLKNKILSRKKEFEKGFNEAIKLVDANLEAGYSLENAFVDVTDNLPDIGECGRYLKLEFARVVSGLNMNKNIEELLQDMGKRTQIKSITDFAALVSIAKKQGGNIIYLIRQFGKSLSRKMILEQELDTMVTAKRLEGRIMIVMPILIILYLKISNPGYMDCMFESIFGKVIMTGCLMVTFAATYFSNKIVDGLTVG